MNTSMHPKSVPQPMIGCVALSSFSAASLCLAEDAAKLAFAAETGYVGAAAVSRMRVSSSVTTVDVTVIVKTPGTPNLTKSLQITAPSA